MQQPHQSCDSAAVDVTALSTRRDHTVDHATVLSIIQQCRRWCDGTVGMMQQHSSSSNSAFVDVLAPSTCCDSGVDYATVLLTWCDSTVDHATVPLLMWGHCWHDVTALLIMQQCHSWCEGTVDMMWQHCWSCNSAIVDVSVLSTWCDSGVNHATVLTVLCWYNSTVDHATVPSLMCRRRQCDATVVLIMQQCCWHDVTALLIIWQHCRSFDSDVAAMTIIWQCCCWCDGTVDVIWQHCRSCNSALVNVMALLTWCDSTIDHEITVPLLMCWRRQCDSTVLLPVDHGEVLLLMRRHCWRDAIALLIMLWHDWQHCHLINSSTVTCSTAITKDSLVT